MTFEGFALGCRKWGCNKWGLKGCLAALPGNRPKLAFRALFLPFSPCLVRRAPEKSRISEQKGLCPQISSDLLEPPSLKPPFAALKLQGTFLEGRRDSFLLCHASPETMEQQAPNPDGPNRQLPIATVQRTRSILASHSAVPRGTNTTPMNANRAIGIAAQRTQGL